MKVNYSAPFAIMEKLCLNSLRLRLPPPQARTLIDGNGKLIKVAHWNLFRERNDVAEDGNEKIYNLHVILVLIIAHEMFKMFPLETAQDFRLHMLRRARRYHVAFLALTFKAFFQCTRPLQLCSRLSLRKWGRPHINASFAQGHCIMSLLCSLSSALFAQYLRWRCSLFHQLLNRKF